MNKTVAPAIAVEAITAGEALAANRFVNAAGSYVASAGDRAIGITASAAASGDEVAVICAGTALVTAGGNITAGQAVQSTDAGKATAVADPTVDEDTLWTVLGEAIDAGADGDLIRVILR